MRTFSFDAAHAAVARQQALSRLEALLDGKPYPHLHILTMEDIPHGWKEMEVYNNTSVGEWINPEIDDDWDDLICSIKCELHQLDRMHTRYRRTICKYAGDWDLLNGTYRKFRGWEDGIHQIRYFMFEAIRLTGNYKDFEKIYEFCRKLKEYTLADLMNGEKYTYHLEQGQYETRVFNFN